MTAPRPLRTVITFPFPIYPVNSGGALRGFFLLREFTRHFDTVALVVGAAEEIQTAIEKELGEESAGLRVQQIPVYSKPRTRLHRIRDRFTTFLNSGSWRVSTNSVVLGTTKLLGDVIQKHKPDAVVLTNLESWVCGGMLKRLHPEILRIIDMPNVEHVLYAQQLKAMGSNPECDSHWKRLKQEESNLHRVTQGLFACSDEDTGTLRDLNANAIPCATIPNGVACEHIEYDPNQKKHESRDILFCGTLSYPPNIDGLSWFVKEVFPIILASHADVRLRVVGRHFDADKYPGLQEHPSVDVVGEVDLVHPEYQRAGIALCPLRMGSGTRLKILESMSFGNPMVATSIGCEGISAVDGETILIRDEASSFADGVNKLLSSPLEFNRLRENARRFVEANYDWKVIGRTVANTLADWHSSNQAEQ
jgi:glycosyltransferase involved in cell wall biosynthesis